MSTSLGAPSRSVLHGKTLKHCFSHSRLWLLGKKAKASQQREKAMLREAPGNKAPGSSPQCSRTRIVDHRSFSDRLSGQVQGTPATHSASQLQNVRTLRGSQVFSLKHTVYANSLVAINYSYQSRLVRVAAKSIRSQPKLFLQAGRTEKASQSCGLSLFRPPIDRPLTKLCTIMSLAGR